MIIGVITGRHVWRHPISIARGFGVGVLVRALVAAVDWRTHTFLRIVSGN